MQLTRTLNSLVVAPEKATATLTLDDILVDFPICRFKQPCWDRERMDTRFCLT